MSINSPQVNATIINKEFKSVEVLVVCSYNALVKSSIAYTRYLLKNDEQINGKVISTAISQDLRCIVTKGTEVILNNFNFSDELFELLIYVPVIIGTEAMYIYRYCEASLWRNDFPFKASGLFAVAGVGLAIGYIGTYLKGTVFGKQPNLLYDVAALIYNPTYNFELERVIWDAHENILVAAGESVLKKVISPVSTKAEDFAKWVQWSIFPSSQPEETALTVDQQNMGSNKIRKVVHMSWNDMHGRCKYLDDIYSSLNGYFNIIKPVSEISDSNFLIEEVFEVDEVSSVTCKVPCFDQSGCESNLRIYNSTRNEIVSIPARDVAASCPEVFLNDISSTLHGLLLNCEVYY